jgi:hypothetical protein
VVGLYNLLLKIRTAPQAAPDTAADRPVLAGAAVLQAGE